MISCLRRLLLFSIFAMASLAWGNSSPIAIPETKQVFNAAAPDIFEGTPQLELSPQTPGAPRSKVYVRKNSQGLIIAGSVTGTAPRVAKNAAEVMRNEHLEIWLSVTANPDMPPIGWGNQFADIDLPKGEASCDEWAKDKDQGPGTDVTPDQCREFVRKQNSYRAYFKRLFVRQWQLAPGAALETFATASYQTIQERFAQGTNESTQDILPVLLKPVDEAPPATFKAGPSGYDFEVLVPWNAFPPSADETLRDISLLVEAYGPAPAGKRFGPYATSAPGRQYGNAATFNQFRFEVAREYELTPCDYELVGLDIHDEPTKALFLPANSDLISDVFILENYKRGYAYAPTGLSPRTRPTHFFWKKVADNEYVCGPILRYKKGEQVKDLEITQNENTFQVIVDEDTGFDARRLSNGTVLMKDGPREVWSKYGSGQCGACPRGYAAVYTLSSDLKIKRVFDVEDVVGNEISDMDIQFSPDWSRIGVYRFKTDWIPNQAAKAPTWRDQSYCLKDDNYEQCGPEGHDPAPEPRTLKFEQQY